MGTTTGAVAGFLSLRAHLDSGKGLAPVPMLCGCVAPTETLDLGCVLLNLRECCTLPESLSGFKAALADTGSNFVETLPGAQPPSRTVIVPGCVLTDLSAAQDLSASLRAGTSVLLETGAGFADATVFEKHQELLFLYFGLRVSPTVDVWAGLEGRQRVPYVDLTWPIRTKVRDFSRVVPVSARADEVIGWVDGHAVAMKRRVGKGTLVFLGSPLGPTLLAGDLEARRWLREMLVSI